MPLRVDGDVVRPGQVVRLAAPRPELGEELPVELRKGVHYDYLITYLNIDSIIQIIT